MSARDRMRAAERDGGGDGDSDSDSGGSGGTDTDQDLAESVGSVTRDRGGAGAGGGDEPSAGLGSGDDGDSGGADTDPGGSDPGGDASSPGSSPGGSSPPPADVGGPGSVDDTGTDATDPGDAPSAQQPETGTDTPNIEGGDQRLFNEAAEQQRERVDVALQSGGDQRLRNQATPNIEGGDARLFAEERELRREAAADEEFGDVAIENPLTGNRVEEDLDRASDAFQDRAPGVIRRTATIGTPVGTVGTARARDDPTAGARGAFPDALADTADPFELASGAKEVAEFAATQPTRLLAPPGAGGEQNEFGQDVQDRVASIATQTAESATESPIEFAVETGTSLLAGSGAATAGRRATSVARDRAPDVRTRISDELDVARALRDNDRAMANFPDQRTIEREAIETPDSDLDRLESEVGEQSLRDRARQRLPPREEFPSDAAYRRELEALEERLARSELEEIAEETQQQSTRSDLDGQQTAGSQRGGRGQQREAEAVLDRDPDTDSLFAETGTATAATGDQLEAEATAQQSGTVGLADDLARGQVGVELGDSIETGLSEDITADQTTDQTIGQTTDTVGSQTTTGTTTTTTATTTATQPPATATATASLFGGGGGARDPDAPRDDPDPLGASDDEPDESLLGVRDVEFVLDPDPLGDGDGGGGGSLL